MGSMQNKKYVNFLYSIATNRRPELVSLLNSVKTTCSSVTGGNLRKILLDTNVKIEPGVSKGCILTNFVVYPTPVGQEWRLPLLLSLLEVKDSRWEINFDEETGQLGDDEITALLSDVCVG